MKIAVFHNLPPGGAKRVVYEEVRFLSGRNRLFLFELDSTDESFLDIRPYFEKVITFPFEIKSNLSGYLSRLEKDYQNFFRLRLIQQQIAAQIDKESFDVCLIHPDKYTQAPFLLRYLKTPSVYLCEELLRIAYEKELYFMEKVGLLKTTYENLTRSWRRKIDRKNSQSASKILVASAYLKEQVKRAYLRKAVICPLGVETKVFRPYSVKRENQILFIGRKDKISGYNFTQKILSSPQIRSRLKLKTVVFSPNFSDQDLAKEYSRSLLTLCTSYHEPFGLTALESMACGTPVLAVNEGGFQETVVDNQTGFLLPRKLKEFVDKIALMFKNPQLVEKMGKTARKYVKERWSWENHHSCLACQL